MRDLSHWALKNLAEHHPRQQLAWQTWMALHEAYGLAQELPAATGTALELLAGIQDALSDSVQRVAEAEHVDELERAGIPMVDPGRDPAQWAQLSPAEVEELVNSQALQQQRQRLFTLREDVQELRPTTGAPSPELVAGTRPCSSTSHTPWEDRARRWTRCTTSSTAAWLRG